MQNRQDGGANKREHYRIRYPLSCRPSLIVLNQKCEVVDISEHGISFVCNKVHELHPDLEVEARITFKDGESLNLEGKILRINKRIAVLYLPVSIPFGRIVAEQRLLKEEYPEYR